MLLAVDVGNTNITVGCFDRQQMLFTERISTDRSKTSLEFAILFQTAFSIHAVSPREITGAIIGSVVPPITPVVRTAIRKVFQVQALTVGPGLKTGMSIRLDDPSSVGADLIAGAVGALSKYEAPIVIIDMGTATTMIVIDENRNYIGGMIMPGIRVSLDSLISETSMLQGISLETPKKVIGRNTVDAMRSGILYGHAAMIDGLIVRAQEEAGENLRAVATGGLAPRILGACRHEILYDPNLVLDGLRVIYEKNSAGGNARRRSSRGTGEEKRPERAEQTQQGPGWGQERRQEECRQ